MFRFSTERHACFVTAGMTAIAGAVVLITGCSTNVVEYESGSAESDSDGEVAYVKDGIRVYPNPPTGADADVDPCTLLSESTLDLLGLTDLEPAELPSYTPDDGCSWSGVNNFVTPDLELRVNGYTETDPALEIRSISEVPVAVYAAFGNNGRYIAHFDDLTLSINYLGAKVEVDAHDALTQAMVDVLDAYGRGTQ